MAEDKDAAPRDAHGFLHIGCSPLEIRDGRVNAELAGLANQIVSVVRPCKHSEQEVFSYLRRIAETATTWLSASAKYE